MGTLALLLDQPPHSFAVDEAAAARLAELGVTRVSLLRDDRSIAMVLEGWAFDAGGDAEAAEVALLGRKGRARQLISLAQISLSPSR
jgi:hypothetical protein